MLTLMIFMGALVFCIVWLLVMAVVANFPNSGGYTKANWVTTYCVLAFLALIIGVTSGQFGPIALSSAIPGSVWLVAYVVARRFGAVA